MARVNAVGWTKTISSFWRLEDKSKGAAVAALEKAGDVAAEMAQIKAEEVGLRDTGKMIKSIRRGPAITNYGAVRVEVWPQGSRRRGKRMIRNGLIGFVQHYGRGYETKSKRIHMRPPTNFFALTTEDKRAIGDTIEKEWDNAIGKLNG